MLDWASGPVIPKPVLMFVGRPPTKKPNRDIWEDNFQGKIQKHNAAARKQDQRKHIVEAETQSDYHGSYDPKRTVLKIEKQEGNADAFSVKNVGCALCNLVSSNGS